MNSCSVAVEWNSGEAWQHGVDQAAAMVEQWGNLEELELTGLDKGPLEVRWKG